MSEVVPDDAADQTATATPVLRRVASHPLAKYVVIGGLCFVIDAGLLWVCTSILGWPVWVGATIGYWVGLLVNFTLNRTVMSAPRSGNLVRQTTRYAVLLGVNYVITLAFLHLAATWGLPVVAGKTIIVAASTCWNYLLYRGWVFA